MPMLDVMDVLLDPDFCEELTIQRRQQGTDAKGRAALTVTTIDPKPFGVVEPVADQPMVRGPDQQNLPRLLSVHTPFRLRGPSRDGAGVDFQPDLIIWNGDPYVVNKVQDYSHYGAGWVQADCSSEAATERPPA